MKEQSLNKFLGIVSVEERVIKDYKEVPCKDMDMDCFAFDGKFLLAITKNAIITLRNWEDVFFVTGAEEFLNKPLSLDKIHVSPLG